ncbi:MAG: hypothetical protein XD41_1154 [Desulfonauticus sp. 38_4375]|nr:MAG: hypothetical protein XD41_1154 [Desulfonauticus sp. 38_4375]
MFINKEAILKMYEQGMFRDQKDLGEVLNSVVKEIIETIYQAELTETLGIQDTTNQRKLQITQEMVIILKG